MERRLENSGIACRPTSSGTQFWTLGCSTETPSLGVSPLSLGFSDPETHPSEVSSDQELQDHSEGCCSPPCRSESSEVSPSPRVRGGYVPSPNNLNPVPGNKISQNVPSTSTVTNNESSFVGSVKVYQSSGTGNDGCIRVQQNGNGSVLEGPHSARSASGGGNGVGGAGSHLPHHLQHLRHLTPRDWKLAHSDSGQSSLEYWDYSVELEMLKGPEDLQLAAELGKTLLERNRELENSIRQQQTVIDDHLQEIEYLSKQTAALREVNDSRLRIYEQLEISIQDLEKTNQRLNSDAGADRRKIKSLISTVEALDSRNEELQKRLEEAREERVEGERGRQQRRGGDDGGSRRALSCEHSKQDDRSTDESDNERQVEKLSSELELLRAQLHAEQSRRGEVEAELTALSQEHESTLHQLSLQQRLPDPPLTSLKDELAALDDDASERLCSKCLGSVADSASNPTVFELSESIEDGGEPSLPPSERGGCALVRLANGAMAWGSQESLASLGQMVSQVNSCVTSPATDASEAPHNSLLSELDTQYRILIEKYEALLDAREQQDLQQQHRQQQLQLQQQMQGDERNLADDHQTEGHSTGGFMSSSDAEEMSGPMSLVLTNNESCSTNMTLKCQRCANCSCGIATAHHRPKSNLEEFSEVETSSSGFSEGESRLFNKTTQTECMLQLDRIDEATPTAETAMIPAHFLDLKSPINPCDKRFQAAPEYKKLFQEIFTVLKKTVNENDEMLSSQNQTNSNNNMQHGFDCTTPAASQACDTDSTAIAARTVETSSIRSEDSDSQYATSTVSNSTNNVEVNNVVNVLKNAAKAVDQEINLTSSSNLEGDEPVDSDANCSSQNRSDLSNVLKPIRPNSLDLASNTNSRSSSRQRRRRRQQKIRLESGSSQQKEHPVEPSEQKTKSEIKQAESNENNIRRQEDLVRSREKNVDQSEESGESVVKSAKPSVSSSNPMNLCTKHRQQQNRNKARRNRSRNRSGHRLPIQDPRAENLRPLDTFAGHSLHRTSESVALTIGEPQSSDAGRRVCSRGSAWNRPPPGQTRPGNNPPHHHTHRHRDGGRSDENREHRDRQENRKNHGSPCRTPWATSVSRTRMSLPSAEVAKLRKLEMTYAEVLKSHLARAANRKH